MAKNESINRSFWILIAVLFTAGLFLNWFEQRGETHAARESFREFPAKIGDWEQRGREIRFGEQTESILRTTDYTMREYVLPDGNLANVYAGYYASQRTGATYHSPQNCLPGSGWIMKQPENIEIFSPSGKKFTANKFLIENGQFNEVLIYWYQGRGRIVASEYSDKVYTVMDSILRNRSDGAMVRVMTSVGNSEEEATKRAVELSGLLADKMTGFVPE